MEVKVAKTAGFCFGVKRAVDQVYQQIDSGKKPIYTYGPIIHNEEVVAELAAMGVQVIEREEDLKNLSEGTIIIRSHGVAKSVYDRIARTGLTLVDATCPFVKKIHHIVEESSRKGSRILIVGNEGHPEVEGIKGWCSGAVTVVSSEEEAFQQSFSPEETVCVVSQTTFNLKKFHKIVEIFTKIGYDGKGVLNTICSATEERQTEAREIAQTVDVMIVIGSRQSSNTRKLYEICQKECANTYYIQTLKDLDFRHLPSSGCVGITAGASTPKKLIEEVSKQWQT